MKVKAKSDTRIRQQPFDNNNELVIGLLPNGKVIDAEPVPSAPDWLRWYPDMDGIKLQPSALNRWSPYCYARRDLFSLVIDPPIERNVYKHAKYQLGVNVLQYAQYAQQAFKDGCRFAMLMDNGGAAIQLARDYPDGIVMYRRYHNAKLSSDSMFKYIDVDWRTVPGNFYCTLSNENDTQNPNNLPEYFPWFEAVARNVWSVNPNAKLCFGTWGHGNPNWVDQSTVNYWRATVAPWLNANAHRVACDLHTYTKGKRRPEHPPHDAEIIGAEWFETRHQFAYRNGLDAAVKHVSGEAGVEAGHGGFPWAGYSGAQFREWAADVVNLQRACNPVPLGGALFHYGENPGWRGYLVNGFYNDLREMWANDIPAKS